MKCSKHCRIANKKCSKCALAWQEQNDDFGRSGPPVWRHQRRIRPDRGQSAAQAQAPQSPQKTPRFSRLIVSVIFVPFDCFTQHTSVCLVPCKIYFVRFAHFRILGGDILCLRGCGVYPFALDCDWPGIPFSTTWQLLSTLSLPLLRFWWCSLFKHPKPRHQGLFIWNLMNWFI